MARTFSARFRGVCPECEGPVVVGEPVSWTPGPVVGAPGRTVHVQCPEPAPLPDPCPRCFMVPAANGACGCDD